MVIPNDTTLKEVKSNANKAILFFPPNDSEQKILSEKFLTVSHLQEVLFKHILIKTTSFIWAWGSTVVKALCY
jgi:hypothetical protein